MSDRKEVAQSSRSLRDWFFQLDIAERNPEAYTFTKAGQRVPIGVFRSFFRLVVAAWPALLIAVVYHVILGVFGQMAEAARGARESLPAQQICLGLGLFFMPLLATGTTAWCFALSLIDWRESVSRRERWMYVLGPVAIGLVFWLIQARFLGEARLDFGIDAPDERQGINDWLSRLNLWQLGSLAMLGFIAWSRWRIAKRSNREFDGTNRILINVGYAGFILANVLIVAMSMFHHWQIGFSQFLTPIGTLVLCLGLWLCVLSLFSIPRNLERILGIVFLGFLAISTYLGAVGLRNIPMARREPPVDDGPQLDAATLRAVNRRIRGEMTQARHQLYDHFVYAWDQLNRQYPDVVAKTTSDLDRIERYRTERRALADREDQAWRDLGFAQAATVRPWLRKPQTVEQAFRNWMLTNPSFPVYRENYDRAVARLRQNPKRTDVTLTRMPVFIVCAEGGGIRAAATSLLSLSRLTAVNPKFAERTFCISSVSGGSVGSALYTSLLPRPQRELPLRSNLQYQTSPLEGGAIKLLSQDYLSPVVLRLFTSDLLAALIPMPVNARSDRSKALTEALDGAVCRYDEERASSMLSDNDEERMCDGDFTGDYDSKLFTAPLSSYSHTEDRPFYVALNATNVNTGQRVVFSELPLSDMKSAARDYKSLMPNHEISMGFAASLSSRFPVITTSGVIDIDGNRWRMVDGGYADNSGTKTALDIYRKIVDAPFARYVRVYVLVIGNPISETDRETDAGAAAEVLSPARTAMNVLSKDNSSVARSLKNEFYQAWLGGLNVPANNGFTMKNPWELTGQPVFKNITWSEREYKVPLGWMLSRATVRDLQTQVSGSTETMPRGAGSLYIDVVEHNREVMRQIGEQANSVPLYRP